MVEREGFEPPETYRCQIYSLMRLTTSPSLNYCYYTLIYYNCKLYFTNNALNYFGTDGEIRTLTPEGT